MDNLFSTHPDTGNRIAALQAMADEMASQPVPTAQAPSPDQTTEGPWDSTARPRNEPQQPKPKANPWGRNPTGPKGPWS
jgi:heat shock protein HtpX